MTYSEKLKDPRWQRKRLEILEAAKFKCEDCGNSKNTLTVHHCYYEFGREWTWEIETGINGRMDNPESMFIKMKGLL